MKKIEKINIVLEVSQDLEIIDKCYCDEINHGSEYDQDLIVEDSVEQCVSRVISKLAIRSKTWNKQKLAEHCNDILLSHSSHIIKPLSHKPNYDIYYPHLRLFVYEYLL